MKLILCCMGLLAAIPEMCCCADMPLVVGVHDNLVPKGQGKRADIALGHLIDYIGQRIGVPTRLDILPSGTRRDLESTAKLLQAGRLHVVAMSVLEYNWLRQLSGKDVDILVVTDPGIREVQQCEQLVVREKRVDGIAGLRGATLAAYDQPLPSVSIYLSRLQNQWGSDFLQRRTRPLATPIEALDAVFSGKADAAIIDLMAMRDYKEAYPGREAKLEVIGRSPSYPVVPIVGNSQQVNKLRIGLWRSIQDVLNEIEHQPRAVAFREVWRVKRFILPNEKYRQSVEQSAKEFPFSELPIGLPD
jgi:ABC-type phosphate/phosphonate transport system substrate-binding protein